MDAELRETIREVEGRTVSLARAAAALGISGPAALYRIRRGTLDAEMIEGKWRIDRNDLAGAPPEARKWRRGLVPGK